MLGEVESVPGSGLSVFKLKFSAFFRQGTDRLKVQGHSSSKWGNWHLNSVCEFMAMAQRGMVNSPGSHSPRTGSYWLPSSPGKAMTPDSQPTGGGAEVELARPRWLLRTTAQAAE